MSSTKYQTPLEKYGETTMKIGKHKGKTLDEIAVDDGGKKYLFWFVDNVINEENEKFYFKLKSYVNYLKGKEGKSKEMARASEESD